MPALTIDIEARLAAFQDSLNQLNTQAAGVASRLESSFGKVQTVFAGLAALAGAAGFVGLIRNSIDAADELNKLGQKTGIAVEQLSALQYAAKLSDVTTEQLAVGLRKLAQNIDSGSDSFDRIGVKSRNADGSLRATDAVLLDLAQRFSVLADGAGKTAIAQDLLGKTGSDLIPLLNAGRAGLQAYADEAKRAGLIISGETAKASEEFNDNLTALRGNLQGLGTLFAAQLVGPLAEVTRNLLDASRAAGSFGGGLLHSILGEGKNVPAELRSIELRIAAVRAEREKLKGSFGDSDFARSIPGLSRVKDLELQEQELKSQREYLLNLQKIRDENARRDADANRPKATIAPPPDKAPKGKKDNTLQEQINAARETGRLTAEQAKDEAAIAAARNQVDNYLPQAERERKAAEDAARAAADLASVIDATPGAKIADLERKQLLVNDAFTKGKLTVDQFNEAFTVIEEQRNRVLGRADKDFMKVGDDGKEAFRSLENAVRGWGNAFTDTLADAVLTGKASFQDLANSVIRDLLRMEIQASITKPLFEGLTGVLANVPGLLGFGGSGAATSKVNFGGGYASGGDISGGTAYLVGEKGPELFLPRNSGKIIPNNQLGGAGRGGGNVIQNITFNGGMDPAQQQAFARDIRLQTMAGVMEAMRRGDPNFAPRVFG